MAAKDESTMNSAGKRTQVSQKDVPRYSLAQALRIPEAVLDHYAGEPTKPLLVADALGIKPGSSQFKMLCGSAIAYGLTVGGYNADVISITDLARKILRPTAEGIDAQGRREAVLNPRVIGEFLRKYDGNRLPREDIARNVLVEMKVPEDAAERTWDLIQESAAAVGFFREIKGDRYVNLAVPIDSGAKSNGISLLTEDPSDVEHDTPEVEELRDEFSKQSVIRSDQTADQRRKRVFVTHGKNKAFVEPLSELLAFGEFEPVVSVDRQTVSKPVPDKVLDDMRSCSAAIIHVEDERKLLDADGEQHVVLNSNVLIEIGAAMALFGRRFVLLVREGVELPSNLQGLYEVRYSGEKLDAEGTIKVLKAMKDIKNYPLPSDRPKEPQQE